MENSDCVRFGEPEVLSQQQGRAKFERDGEDVAHAESAEQQREWREAQRRRAKPGRGGWWPIEPDICRVAYGVPSRVDRLKCLGNAVVPQQFYPVFQAIADIEKGIIHG